MSRKSRCPSPDIVKATPPKDLAIAYDVSLVTVYMWRRAAGITSTRGRKPKNRTPAETVTAPVAVVQSEPSIN